MMHRKSFNLPIIFTLFVCLLYCFDEILVNCAEFTDTDAFWIAAPEERISGSEHIDWLPWGEYLPAPVSDPKLMSFDSTPELNLVPLSQIPESAIVLPRRSEPMDGTADWGSWLNQIQGSPSSYGSYAAQQVQSGLNLPSAPPDRTLYAPTHMCPNYSPLESVTAYWRYSSMGYTGRGWGCWDHPGGGWAVFKSIDSGFLSNYVRNYKQGAFYFTEIFVSGSKTDCMLYNFNTGKWEIQYTSYSRSTWNVGWDMWETYFESTCPTLPRIASGNVQLYINGNWVLVDWRYGSLLSYPYCTNYEYRMVKSYHRWVVQMK